MISLLLSLLTPFLKFDLIFVEKFFYVFYLKKKPVSFNFFLSKPLLLLPKCFLFTSLEPLSFSLPLWRLISNLYLLLHFGFYKKFPLQSSFPFIFLSENVRFFHIVHTIKTFLTSPEILHSWFVLFSVRMNNRYTYRSEVIHSNWFLFHSFHWRFLFIFDFIFLFYFIFLCARVNILTHSHHITFYF